MPITRLHRVEQRKSSDGESAGVTDGSWRRGLWSRTFLLSPLQIFVIFEWGSAVRGRSFSINARESPGNWITRYHGLLRDCIERGAANRSHLSASARTSRSKSNGENRRFLADLWDGAAGDLIESELYARSMNFVIGVSRQIREEKEIEKSTKYFSNSRSYFC